MKISRLSAVLAMFAMLTVIIGGCGSSDDFIPQSNTTPTGNVQVQFSRSNVLAQTTDTAFSTADTYAVSVLRANTNELAVPTSYVAPNTSQDQQVIVVTSLYAGSYDVVVTAFRGGLATGQIAARNTATSDGNTTIVGSGAGSQRPLTTYPGPFVPGSPTGATTGTTGGATTGGGYGTTGGTTGGTTTGGGYGTTTGGGYGSTTGGGYGSTTGGGYGK